MRSAESIKSDFFHITADAKGWRCTVFGTETSLVSELNVFFIYLFIYFLCPWRCTEAEVFWGKQSEKCGKSGIIPLMCLTHSIAVWNNSQKWPRDFAQKGGCPQFWFMSLAWLVLFSGANHCFWISLWQNLHTHLDKFSDKYDQLVAFKPTGWTFDQCSTLERLQPKTQGNITIYGKWQELKMK